MNQQPIHHKREGVVVRLASASGLWELADCGAVLPPMQQVEFMRSNWTAVTCRHCIDKNHARRFHCAACGFVPNHWEEIRRHIRACSERRRFRQDYERQYSGGGLRRHSVVCSERRRLRQDWGRP